MLCIYQFRRNDRLTKRFANKCQAVPTGLVLFWNQHLYQQALPTGLYGTRKGEAGRSPASPHQQWQKGKQIKVCLNPAPALQERDFFICIRFCPIFLYSSNISSSSRSLLSIACIILLCTGIIILFTRSMVLLSCSSSLCSCKMSLCSRKLMS